MIECVDGKSLIRKFPDGTMAYYYDGVLHREDGPALYGPTHTSWYINGTCVYDPQYEVDPEMDAVNLLKEYNRELSEEFKKSIIKHELSKHFTIIKS